MPFRQKSGRAELAGWLAIRKLLVAGIVRFYVSLALPASRRAVYLAPPRSVRVEERVARYRLNAWR